MSEANCTSLWEDDNDNDGDDAGAPTVKVAKQLMWNNEYEEGFTSTPKDDNVELRFIYLFKGTQNLLHLASFQDKAASGMITRRSTKMLNYIPHVKFYYAEMDIVYRKKSLAVILLELL